MTQYRDHRGTLADSMETCREFSTRAALIDYLRKELAKYGRDFANDALVIDPSMGADKRIGWDNVHMVYIRGYGVAGFTDGPLE